MSLSDTYRTLPLTFQKATGSYITVDNGNKYLDLAGGLGVCLTGYSHPEINSAIKKASENVVHVPNYLICKEREILADHLCKITEMKEVFFANSGTEAVECAIKAAKLYAAKADNADKFYGICTLASSFHGRSCGSLSLTGISTIKEPFLPLLSDIRKLPFEDTIFSELFPSETQIDKESVHSDKLPYAIFVEPVQGQTMRVLSRKMVYDLNKLAQSGVLIIADECQSGMFRTGTFTASENLGLNSSIIILSKPLGGGLPLAACLFRDKAAGLLKPGIHGSTFGGNYLAVIAGLSSLRVLENELKQNMTDLSNIMEHELSQLSYETGLEIRGLGLMRGIVMKSIEQARKIRDIMLEKRVIIDFSSSVIRLYPPAVTPPEDLICALKEIKSSAIKLM